MLWIILVLILIYCLVKRYINVHDFTAYGKDAWKQWNTFKKELEKDFKVKLVDVDCNTYYTKFYYSLKKKD